MLFSVSCVVFSFDIKAHGFYVSKNILLFYMRRVTKTFLPFAPAPFVKV